MARIAKTTPVDLSAPITLTAGVIERLSEPLLRPLRRVVPLVGGLDLAPLVALVLLQVAMIVLGHLQAGALVGLSGLG